MFADAAASGALWPSLIIGVVLVLTLLAWALDHARLRRRMAALERSEAFLTTDLGDARRDVAALRDSLRADAATDDAGARRTTAEPPAPFS